MAGKGFGRLVDSLGDVIMKPLSVPKQGRRITAFKAAMRIVLTDKFVSSANNGGIRREKKIESDQYTLGPDVGLQIRLLQSFEVAPIQRAGKSAIRCAS